jgi:hypothetical protein
MNAGFRDMADGQQIDWSRSEWKYPVALVRKVCGLAGRPSYLEDLRAELRRRGILQAIAGHDTPKLFDWLAEAMSYQGIADAIAGDYIKVHGRATWRGIERRLSQCPSCPKLGSYWQFHGCRYRKGSGTCSEPEHLPACPLPTHRLRNGQLNQLAYSLFLLIRDLMGGDLVAWLDRQLAGADQSVPDRIVHMREALLGPLRHLGGASDKVLSMALSDLLLGGRHRPRWVEVGGSMIVVDTLVHNFLARTGILARLQATHAYGPACYRSGGCATILQAVAVCIDAREFNPDFPAAFPRFVQSAIWRYCAADGLDVCNGNRIDDERSCQNRYCRLFPDCDRVALRPQSVVPDEPEKRLDWPKSLNLRPISANIVSIFG